MEAQGLPLDMISNLPPSIIKKILNLLPMRDAFRTSVLSRKWRRNCLNITKLEFNDEVLKGLGYPFNKYEVLHVMYTVLLLHQGPLVEFCLCSSYLRSCCEIDQILLHVAMRNSTTLEKFTLCVAELGKPHKLLSSFFSLQQLTHLKLVNCAFQPPPTFCGFTRLTSLSFHNVNINTKLVINFISNCPLLKSLTLFEDEIHFAGTGDSDLVELLNCLPMIEHLEMNRYPVMCFGAGVMPNKLPTALLHLRFVHLSGLSLSSEDELHIALLLVINSPNIEKIKIQLVCYPIRAVLKTKSATNLIDLQHYHPYVKLDHLCEIEITNMQFVIGVMEFVKLILAKSSRLETVGLITVDCVAANDEVEMLRKLLEYPRVSKTAKILVSRPSPPRPQGTRFSFHI